MFLIQVCYAETRTNRDRSKFYLISISKINFKIAFCFAILSKPKLRLWALQFTCIHFAVLHFEHFNAAIW